jgi:hypothetical protein
MTRPPRSPATTPGIMPRRATAIGVLLLVLFVLIAAAVNVPWALTFMRSRTTIIQVPTMARKDSQMPRAWPATTPHNVPWPPPNAWIDGQAFGFRMSYVYGGTPSTVTNAFQMEVHLLGWPFPVIEQKQMWWDWDDPKLNGPEPDPALSLRLQGLILNPLILGGGTWLILIAPWLIAIRLWRHRRNRCMACGYPIGASPVCTECGGAVSIQL